jgi:hypothetical protein
VRLDPGGLDDITIYHRTTEGGARSMTTGGVSTDVSRGHVWAGQGFYGSSSPNIPGTVGARGDTIVAQNVSTQRMKTITDPGFIAMQQDTAAGKAMRVATIQQMKKAAEDEFRTLGRVPSDADVATKMRDYMSKQMNTIAPNADVVRWRNPDGTYTYVVRNESAPPRQCDRRRSNDRASRWSVIRASVSDEAAM